MNQSITALRNTLFRTRVYLGFSLGLLGVSNYQRINNIIEKKKQEQNGFWKNTKRDFQVIMIKINRVFQKLPDKISQNKDPNQTKHPNQSKNTNQSKDNIESKDFNRSKDIHNEQKTK